MRTPYQQAGPVMRGQEITDTSLCYSIDVNMRSVVYCSGVRYGSEADWSYVLHRYRLQQSGEEKSHLRAALACTREPYLLRK